MSLYTLINYCLAKKGKVIEDLAKEAGTTKFTTIKKIYEIEKGKITPTGKRVIEALKKYCPKDGLIKRIKARS